jgi:hypothetical protein
LERQKWVASPGRHPSKAWRPFSDCSVAELNMRRDSLEAQLLNSCLHVLVENDLDELARARRHRLTTVVAASDDTSEPSNTVCPRADSDDPYIARLPVAGRTDCAHRDARARHPASAVVASRPPDGGGQSHHGRPPGAKATCKQYSTSACVPVHSTVSRKTRAVSVPARCIRLVSAGNARISADPKRRSFRLA